MHVALVRAINVGGRKLPMADLRAMFADLRLAKCRTLLQSGNVVFDCGRRDERAVEELLAQETLARFELATDYFVRSAVQWRALIDANPFPEEARRDPGHLLVLPLKSSPSRAAAQSLRAGIRGREVIELRGATLYAYYPDGIGTSKLTLPIIERALGTRGTGRNWNTVLKLAALLDLRAP
jgi:uncharacterized protein (DUF1697 family)